MLYEEVASVALLQAWSGYNQRDAEDGVVDATVHREEEMLRQQEGADQAGGLVVDQQRTQQRLLGFEVARRGAVARCFGGCFS